MYKLGMQPSALSLGQADPARFRTSTKFRTHLGACGSVAVSTAGIWLLCSLEPPSAPTLATAALYVLLSVTLGIAAFLTLAPAIGKDVLRIGSRLAISWVVIPPAALLLRADSRLCVCAGMLIGATFALAMVEEPDRTDSSSLAARPSLQFKLFKGETSSALPPWPTVLLSCLLYATALATAKRYLLLAACLGAIAAALAGFRWASFNKESAFFNRSLAHQTTRLIVITVASIVITSTLLIPKQVKLAQAEDWSRLQALARVLAGPAHHVRGHTESPSPPAQAAGVPKVLLWPVLPKKTQALVVPPPALKDRVVRRSLTIPFDGPYIYTDPALHNLRTKALVVHGTPLKVKVSSVNGNPISMEARQRIAPAINLSSCRAIEVSIRIEYPPTAIALGVTLADTTLPHNPHLSLATQPIKPEPAIKSGARQETLTFPIPAATRLEAFNLIMVWVLRKPTTAQRGAHIAIENFTLLPR